MPKRNFKKLKASFRSFLETGVLGPINIELTLLEVAALLGPPDWWITDAHSEDLPPLYWGYSRLEISFEPEPPYSVEWFQIEHPDTLKTPRHKLGKLLTMSMDGIDVSVRPSHLLLEFRDLERLEVGIPRNRDQPVLEIYNNTVSIIYVALDRDFEIVDGVTANDDMAAWLRNMEPHFFIDSIYSFRDPAREGQWPKDGWTTIPAAEYLKIIADGETNG